MKNLKTSIKIFVITTSILIPNISCNRSDQNDITNEQMNSTFNKKNDENMSSIQRTSANLENEINAFRRLQAMYPSNENLSPFKIYTNWSSQENLNIAINPNLESMMSYSYEENINYLIDNSILNSSDKLIIDKFKDNLVNGVDFNVALSDFDNSYETASLSEEKLKIFSTVSEAFNLINNAEPNYFGGSSSTNRLFGSCASATVGFAFAAIGLATIEVGSWGSGTALVCAGYVWTSGEWVAACRKH